MLAHGSNLFVEKENLFENYRRYDSTEKGNETIFTCASVHCGSCIVRTLYLCI